MLCTCPNWNHRFNTSVLTEADQRYFCRVDRMSWSSLRAVLELGTCRKPGTIQTSEFLPGKDTVLVFQDACEPALANADDGNCALGRILAHWDWLVFLMKNWDSRRNLYPLAEQEHLESVYMCMKKINQTSTGEIPQGWYTLSQLRNPAQKAWVNLESCSTQDTLEEQGCGAHVVKYHQERSSIFCAENRYWVTPVLPTRVSFTLYY